MTGIHAVLAAALQAPELELAELEAAKLSEAAIAVMRHYDLQASAKAVDWGNLIVTIGVVYGGRIVRIGARRRAENNKRRAETTGFTTVEKVVSEPTMTASEPRRPPAPGPATMPPSRKKTDADLALLNEPEPVMF